MVDYFLQSGRVYDKDGNIVNLVGLFGDGCVPVDTEVYDPEQYLPSNGRVLGEDGRVYALIDILRNIAGSWPGYGSKGQYVWIRYAAKNPTANSDLKTTVDAWMGVYTGMRDKPPESYADFSWYQIKGATGAKGATGPQGVSVTNATVNAAGNLILTLSNGSTIDCGLARGDMALSVYGGSAPGIVKDSDRLGGILASRFITDAGGTIASGNLYIGEADNATLRSIVARRLVGDTAVAGYLQAGDAEGGRVQLLLTLAGVVKSGIYLYEDRVSLSRPLAFNSASYVAKSRNALGIQVGSVTVASVPAGGLVEQEVTFGTPYSATPFVWPVLRSASMYDMAVVVKQRTTTGVVFGVRSRESTTYSVVIEWLAIGAPTV